MEHALSGLAGGLDKPGSHILLLLWESPSRACLNSINGLRA